MDTVLPPLESAVKFLTLLVRSSASYSAIAMAHSALSCFLNPFEGAPFGLNVLVKRLMKGVFENKPTLPKQISTWDVNTVLKELELRTLTDRLTLKEFTLKLCMLLALCSGQRIQTLQSLKTMPDAMQLSDTKCTFFVNSLLKHSK